MTESQLATGSVGTPQLADNSVTAAKISGTLATNQIPNLDAATIATGTLADARLSANVALLNGTNFFTGTNNFAAALVATNASNELVGNFAGSFSGNAANLTNLPPTALSGVLATTQIPALDAAQITTGTFTASQIPDLHAAKITTGTLADARLSTNVALLNGTNLFTGTNTFAAAVIATNLNNQFVGTFTGPGALRWQTVAGTTATAQSNSGYLLTNAAIVTLTLPAAPDVGDVVRVIGINTGWIVAQNSGQQIRTGASATTAGETGSVTGAAWSAIELVHVGGGVFVAAGTGGSLTFQ